MRHPNRESSRFNEDLLPRSMFNSIETWLLNAVLPHGATLSKVQSLVSKFRLENIQYLEKAPQFQIPEMCKACKQRASLLCDFLQGVNELLEQGYTLVPVTRDFSLLKSNYKIRFSKFIAGYADNKDDVILEVNITNNPRMYKFLYYAMELALLDPTWRPIDLQMLTVILQSEAYIFEAVNLTPEEIVKAEDEFFNASQTPDCWSNESELALLMEEAKKDMLSPNPPKYIADFKQVRRSNDGYMFNHPWTIDDAWFSTSSSGCSLTIEGKKMPNIGILTSAFEPDYSDPIDDIIGYKSLYAKDPYPGLNFNLSTTCGVPKTSSRGRRFVHPNCNGRQDRGSYFENMSRHILSHVVLCDTTYDDQEGPRFIKEQQATTENCLVCTDMHSATDFISHQFLLKFWSLIFRPEVPEFLLRCHSGEGLFRRHHIVDGELVNYQEPYNQVSGIKCGTRSNFAVGLTLPHNFICRMTMKACGLEDIDPLTLFRVHGDDITWSLPEDLCDKVITKYTQLANEAGFLVHPIAEKGMLSHHSDLLYRAEFNKLTLLRGRLVSRIPHRLFFCKSNAENQIAVILWLSQYTYLESLNHVIEDILNAYCGSSEVVKAFWNFLIDKKMFGIPQSLRINTVPELSDELKMKSALSIFEEVLTSGVFDAVFNNRQRLSSAQISEKLREFTKFFEDDHVIEVGLQWLEDHGIMSSKLHYIIDSNKRFAYELKDIFDQPYLWISAELGFFSDEEKILIRKCLPYCRISGLDYTMEDIDNLLSVTRILRRMQPHSIGKKIHSSSNVLINCIKKMSQV